MHRRLQRLLRRRDVAPHPRSLREEEEEAEIAENARHAREDADRFAESLLEKAAHRNYPFLKDPPDPR